MQVPKFAKFALVAAAVVGYGFVAAPAHAAAVINSLITPGVINEWEDRDLERVKNAAGAVVTSGEFGLGYTIETILNFTGFSPALPSGIPGETTVNIGDLLPAPYQLNAYAELGVAAIADPGAAPTLGSDTCTFSIVGLGRQCTLFFAPTGNLGANVFAELYERTTAIAGYNETGDPDTVIANIRALTLIAEIGLLEGDDFWVATTLMDLGLAAAQTAGSQQAANGVFGLSVLNNPGAIPIGTNAIQSGAAGTWHDVVGNASAYQNLSGNEGWLVASNTTIDFFAPVPEPGSLALAGLALLGLSAAARRRKV